MTAGVYILYVRIDGDIGNANNIAVNTCRSLFHVAMISTVLLALLTLACMCSSQDLSLTPLTTSQWSVRMIDNSSDHCLLASGNFTLVVPQMNEMNTNDFNTLVWPIRFAFST